MKKLLYAGLLCTLSALANFPSAAADEKPAAAENETPKARVIPFRGKIAAIDKQAKTLKVGERVFQITPETRIMKTGKPANLDDAIVGEEVGGQYRSTQSGKLEALSVRLGAKPAEEPKKTEKKDTP